MSKPRSRIDPRPLLRELTARGVDFVVIGGIAAVVHGSARDTFDLDVCFATDSANLTALGDALVAMGARLRGVDDEVPFVPDAGTLRRVELLTLATPHGNLDVLAAPRGSPGFETLRRRAKRYDLGGFFVRVASVDDLISMKLAAGRKKDVMDVEELEVIREEARRPRA